MSSNAPLRPAPRVQVLSSVLWPSFIAAGIATVLTFSLLDPLHLDTTHGPLVHSRLAGYSAGFLLYWLVCALSSSATVYFAQPIAAVPTDYADANVVSLNAAEHSAFDEPSSSAQVDEKLR
jgi:hypothetical protein